MSAVRLLKKHVKGSYGSWKLAHLPSGRWAAFWYAHLNGEGNNAFEDQCESILLETEPKFGLINVMIPSHATRGDALQYIVRSIEKEICNERSGNERVIEIGLKKARIALLRNKNKVKSDIPPHAL